MFLWLSIYDSEYWFRLGGIIVTFVGSLGIYLGLRRIIDYKWATAGTVAYLLTGGISKYALECGEYNLLLCMMSWAVCCFIYAIKDESAKPLFRFFLFACLSVYSQYDSVFMIIPMYISLIVHFVRANKLTKALLLGTISSAIAAAFLLYFFLIRQMEHQGSIAISHTPVFRHGIIDVFYSAAATGGSIFSGSKYLQLVIAAICGILIIASLPQKNRLLMNLLSVFVSAWLLYYIATAISVYGYNNWNPDSLGTSNIGGRYCLFFVPFLVTTLIYGTYYAYSCFIKLKSGFSKKYLF